MRALLAWSMLGATAQALYFYVDGTAPKCFYEELPKDTLVVGHYQAEEFDDHSRTWVKHEGLSIYISVDVSCLDFLVHASVGPWVEVVGMAEPWRAVGSPRATWNWIGGKPGRRSRR